MSPLGPMDQGSPWAPTRSGGEISSALALLLPDPGPGPGPLASTYHLEGAVGPSCFLWLPVALELVGGRGKQGSVLFRVPAPSSTSGAGAVSIGVAGLPRTPVFRGPWRARKTQGYRGPSWESTAGRAGISLPCSLPQGGVLPADPFTLKVSIPRAALGSWGAPEWGGVLGGSWCQGHCSLGDCQHCHLCQKRKKDGTQGLARDRPTEGLWGGGQEPQGVGKAWLGPEPHQK